ncbi:MAG TPA: carboxypeptidase-like regulatory domain-containing protein, partial [Terriglobia bacterium]|nr:carboxypeptidase-like regulatory domain-containing protein [Terriglobia bacterium]
MTIILTLAAFLLLQAPSRSAAPQSQGVVSGQIRTADGAPAASVRVGAMDLGNPGVSSGDSMLVSIAVTGADGRYQLEGLAAGHYAIFAGPLVLPTYYPGGTTLANASVVTVAAGSTVANVNFSLAQATEGFKVSGRIAWHDRKAVGPTMVALMELDGSGVAGSTAPAADDSFEFTHVHPGAYVLLADIRRKQGIQPLFVTVSDQNVAGLELVIPRVIELTGIALAEDGQTLSQLSMHFVPMSETGTGGESAAIDIDGTFDARLPEGDYRLMSDMLPAGYYFKSLTAGSMDLLREPLKVTAQDSRIRIVAVLARGKPARVKGRITRPEGSTLPARVELTGMALSRPLGTDIKPDGTFTVFSPVMPGTYAASLLLDSGMRISAAPVEIPEKDVAEIEIAAPALREIAGRVSVAGEGPLATDTMLAISRGPAQDLKSVIGRRALFGDTFIRSGRGDLAQSTFQQDGLEFVPLPPEGTFRLTLPEGEYRVVVINRRDFPGAAEPLYDVRALTYGAVNLLNESMKVARRDSADLSVTLEPNPRSRRFQIAGRVLGLTPDTQRAARVILTGDGILPFEIPVAADGSFDFGQVPRGQYTARVTPANELTPNTPVRVTDRDVIGIAIRIPVVRTIQGRITVEGNGPPIGLTFTLEGENGPMTVT